MFLAPSAGRTSRTPSPGRARSSAWRAPLLCLAIAWWPAHAVSAQKASRARASLLEHTVDPGIRPGDDFFAYANGAWLKTNAIPAGKERHGVRDEINAVTRSRIGELVDQADAAPRGSTARKVADYRAAWLNEAAIEARGLGVLTPLLDSIDRIHDRSALTRFLGRRMPADVDPLNIGIYLSSHVLGFAVERSIHGERINDVFLVQGGLGLGDRDSYSGTDARPQSLRATYQATIGRLLALAGSDRVTERAAGVMALETALAETHATGAVSANDRNADNRWTRADFARQAPGMEWTAFFDAAGLGQQELFGVWQPSAIAGLAALVASQPLESWRDYLRVQTLLHLADVLPRAFADEAEALRAAIKGEAPNPAPRAQRALDATQVAMSDAIGRMYADRYFPAAQKTRVRGIVARVTEAFARRVAAIAWMTPASKQVALAKVRSLYVGIGYPERWQDYADLVIDPADALGNLRRIEARNRRRALARVGRAVDLTEWWIAPQSVGAVLIFQLNAYQFSAGLLQAPKFDAAASDAAVYGSIGAIIGHDIVHFVDLLGADYDTTFAMRRWWTARDLAGYQAKTAPLVEQFNGYRPYPDLGVNGTLTLPENAADLGGLEAAFAAHRRALGNRANDREYVKRMDREFFIAFAQSWRTIIGERAMRAQLATNDHAPEMFRVSTVRNLDAWYAAFDVLPGQRLHLAPEARVHVW